jgi:hypothetical protein
MSCKVKNCRYPSSHTTLGHQCGKCGNFGHGVFECGNTKLVMNLLINNKDNLLKPEQYCKVINCPYKEYHTTTGHKCEKCGKFHSDDECIIDNSIVKRFIESKKLLLNCIPVNCFTILNAGMGCKIYIKMNLRKNLSGIFMHSDSWGQYGKNTDDTPVLERFLTRGSYKEIPLIKCPICRNENNTFDLTRTIDNTENIQCSICLQNLNIKYIKLNNCSHVISCIDCFKEYIKR